MYGLNSIIQATILPMLMISITLLFIVYIDTDTLKIIAWVLFAIAILLIIISLLTSIFSIGVAATKVTADM